MPFPSIAIGAVHLEAGVLQVSGTETEAQGWQILGGKCWVKSADTGETVESNGLGNYYQANWQTTFTGLPHGTYWILAQIWARQLAVPEYFDTSWPDEVTV